jgi:hypothetical protein
VLSIARVFSHEAGEQRWVSCARAASFSSDRRGGALAVVRDRRVAANHAAMLNRKVRNGKAQSDQAPGFVANIRETAMSAICCKAGDRAFRQPILQDRARFLKLSMLEKRVSVAVIA